MDSNTIRHGSKMRDAAVDPLPGDYLPPTNAGEVDPHGPDCVSTQATKAGPHIGDDLARR